MAGLILRFVLFWQSSVPAHIGGILVNDIHDSEAVYEEVE